MEFKKHLIDHKETVKSALTRLNELGADAILFVVDPEEHLVGSLTDGDVRRGFIKGFSFDTPLTDFIQPKPIFIQMGKYTIPQLEEYKEKNFKVLPILDGDGKILDVLNFRLKASLLPLEAVVMAGGRGERLMPLTADCPKPLLKVGNKPIIEYNIDRLAKYGIGRVHITIRYLGDQIKSYFGDGKKKGLDIEYIEENEPLGTFGACRLIKDFTTDHVLLMNSDLLTNIDFADFYQSYIDSDADLMVASIPYQVKVPYAVLSIDNGTVVSFDEKPTYSYFSNGGIYLFRKSLMELLPQDGFFNATDFMELLIASGKKVKHYPILGYWLDIGKHEDFEKAQHDVLHLHF